MPNESQSDIQKEEKDVEEDVAVEEPTRAELLARIEELNKTVDMLKEINIAQHAPRGDEDVEEKKKRDSAREKLINYIRR